MSRIGKLPVSLPKGVEAKWQEPVLAVKGPKGDLAVEVKKPCDVVIEEGEIKITRPDDSRQSKSFQGLYRSLANNAVLGVSEGFERRLEIIGVGYKAEVAGDILKLSVGYAFPKEFPIPQGINIEVQGQQVVITGINKQQVGNVAARIRAYRPPEPYKGKGIKYIEEQVRRKAGKAAAGGAK